MNIRFSPRDAARELLGRRRLRSSLTEWALYCGYKPALHHLLMIRELEALERGDFDRLAIAAPPGAAKTTYVSHLFASWYLGRHPDHLVLSGSHTQQFAERKIGRKVRNLCTRHAIALGIQIDDGSRAMDDWALLDGGGYRAVGVGVAVAGERADLGLVEDPFARWEDAQRPIAQDEVWDWYSGDFAPRLKPQARRVIVSTRFNELDLIGRVMERDATLGLKWRYIRLPMLAEENDPLGRQPGERLWPEWFTENQVLEARSDARKWNALYQQNPTPVSGDYFQAEWLRPYTDAPDPKTLSIYGGSDYAVTADGGDWTTHGIIGIDPEGRMYLLDLWRGQKASDVWVEKWCDLVIEWKPIGWAEETGQIKSGIGPFRDQRARERKAYVACDVFPTRGDKAVRAQSIRGRMALNGLYVPVNAPWYPDFRAELMTFPAGKHDDQVDMLGLIGQLLDKVTSGRNPKEPDPVVDDAYRSREEEASERSYDDWKTL